MKYLIFVIFLSIMAFGYYAIWEELKANPNAIQTPGGDYDK